MPQFSAHQMAQLASVFYKNTLLKETGFRKVIDQVYSYKTPHTGDPEQWQRATAPTGAGSSPATGRWHLPGPVLKDAGNSSLFQWDM